jgi:hypothetical protein
MAITLMQLRERERRIEVEYSGQTLGVTYTPGAVTPELVSQVAAREGEPGSEVETMVMALERAVVEWEVLDEQDEKLPPTPEVMRRLPISFLAAVFFGILGDMKVGEVSGGTSDGGLRQRAL